MTSTTGQQWGPSVYVNWDLNEPTWAPMLKTLSASSFFWRKVKLIKTLFFPNAFASTRNVATNDRPGSILTGHIQSSDVRTQLSWCPVTLTSARTVSTRLEFSMEIWQSRVWPLLTTPRSVVVRIWIPFLWRNSSSSKLKTEFNQFSSTCKLRF